MNVYEDFEPDTQWKTVCEFCGKQEVGFTKTRTHYGHMCGACKTWISGNKVGMEEQDVT